MFVSAVYGKRSLFNAHVLITFVHIYLNANKLCLNQKELVCLLYFDVPSNAYSVTSRHQLQALVYGSWITRLGRVCSGHGARTVGAIDGKGEKSPLLPSLKRKRRRVPASPPPAPPPSLKRKRRKDTPPHPSLKRKRRKDTLPQKEERPPSPSLSQKRKEKRLPLPIPPTKEKGKTPLPIPPSKEKGEKTPPPHPSHKRKRRKDPLPHLSLKRK